MKEFLDLTFKHAELDVDKHVEIDPRLYRPHEVPLLLGDASKARKVLGWKPKHDIKSLIRNMFAKDFVKEEAIARGKMLRISEYAYGTTPI